MADTGEYAPRVPCGACGGTGDGHPAHDDHCRSCGGTGHAAADGGMGAEVDAACPVCWSPKPCECDDVTSGAEAAARAIKDMFDRRLPGGTPWHALSAMERGLYLEVANAALTAAESATREACGHRWLVSSHLGHLLPEPEAVCLDCGATFRETHPPVSSMAGNWQHAHDPYSTNVPCGIAGCRFSGLEEPIESHGTEDLLREGLRQVAEGDYPADAGSPEVWAREVLDRPESVRWDSDV